MKTNITAYSYLGSFFYPQVDRIYHNMLSMYRATSQMISDSVAREGRFCCFLLTSIDANQTEDQIVTKISTVSWLRTVKKEILKLIYTDFQKADDLEMISANIVLALWKAVSNDHNRDVLNARRAEVLNVKTIYHHRKQHVRWTDRISKYSIRAWLERISECWQATECFPRQSPSIGIAGLHLSLSMI